MTFDVETQCACCGRVIRFSMKHDLTFKLEDPDSDPMFFAPLVDFTKLKAPSIVDVF